jgi:single-strand DNA-binding protein
MSNLNQFIAQGNLVDDPKVMGQENNVVRFTIAVNNGFGDRKTTTFVDCVGFGKQAEIMGKHLEKGKQILIRGNLIPNSWTNDEGEKRTKLEVQLENVNGFFFVGNSGGSGAPSVGGDEPGEKVPATTGGGEGGTDEQLF